ncbi:long-chain-acyl-CoA synthetase [Proteobacteria bacterium 005FR1]|nr:long-chain-acyl-CoA synthetase [Proteobacteria bacterium 005FR1]
MIKTETQSLIGQQEVPSREETQRKLDLRSEAANRIKPLDFYTLADRIEARADAYGDRDFLVYGKDRFSYGQVDERANQYARVFLERGIGPRDVCAIAIENRPELFFCWFGLAKIGAITTFINYHLTGRPLQHALETTHAKAVVVGEECLQAFADTPEAESLSFWLLPDREKPASATLRKRADESFAQDVEMAEKTRPDRAPRADMRAEEDMLYIFTSGTTGLPKAAKYSHMRWMSSGDVMEVTLDITPEDVFYCCLPLYHGAAATSVTSTALAGGASIVVRRKFSSSRFWDDVREYGITIFQYIGEICRYLLNMPPQANDKDHPLRCMLGAGLTSEVWKRWIERFGDIRVFEGWGATEANAATINLDNYLGSCGRVPDWNKTNLRLLRYDQEKQDYVRDENGFCVHCQPGEVGEAVGYIVNHPEIGGGRFEGYTSEAATESKILRDVFQTGDAWWSSGDLLRYDENGYCFFVDRMGDTFRWKSENVSTQEVADTVGDFPGIEMINIYGVRVPGHEGRAGMAAIVMQQGCEFDPKAFYDVVCERLPHYARPVFVRVAQQADMTTTFKMRKLHLRREGYDPQKVDGPLYVLDNTTGTYEPYDDKVLHRVDLPPFAGDAA